MNSDSTNLRSDGPVREAFRAMRTADQSSSLASASGRRMLWQQRLHEFVTSAPEMHDGREQGAT